MIYSFWQRGINENNNGFLNQSIPKGTYFDKVYDDELAKYVDFINNRSRKRLNWLSPNQVFAMEFRDCKYTFFLIFRNSKPL